MQRAVMVAGALAVTVAVGSPALTAPAAAAEWGERHELTLSVDHGPVGSVVTITGTGCEFEGDDEVGVNFLGDGVASVQHVPVHNSTFSLDFQIPERLERLRGAPAGPTTPGEYLFETNPPACFATFTVTADPPASDPVPDAPSERTPTTTTAPPATASTSTPPKAAPPKAAPPKAAPPKAASKAPTVKARPTYTG